MSSTTAPVDPHAAPTAAIGSRSGKATASLIVGVTSVLLSPFVFTGLVLGVLAVALGSAGRAESGRVWTATSGLVLGAVAIAASIALLIVGVASS